jgi:Tol biopolymer transport system component
VTPAVRRFILPAVGGAALAIAALAYALSAPVDRASAGSIQTGSLIAFESDRGGDSEIWVVSDDGSQPRQLTDKPSGDATPTWTPDGEQIVFASDRGGNWDLYRMNADGSNVVRMTFTVADEFDPVVSPDGERVAFESNREGNWDVFVMRMSGGEQVNLSRSERRDQDPAWSPDPDSSSARIVFTTVQNRTDADVVSVSLRAPGRIQTIMGGSSNDLDAHWSTDDEIVFTRRSGATRDLFVVNANGSGLRDVATGRTDDWGAVWADNGRLLFVRETDPLQRAEPYRIWVMNADGSGERPLVEAGDAIAVEPAPQPGSNPRFVRTQARTRSHAGVLGHCRSLFGNDKPNVLRGTAKRDCIYGRGAGDTIHGLRGGDPVLRGGPGADKLYGWQGRDGLYSVDGERDLVRGGPGGDEAYCDDDIDNVINAAIH